MTSRPPDDASLGLDEIFNLVSGETKNLRDLLTVMQAQSARADNTARQMQDAQASLEKTLQRFSGEIDRALDRLARERALADVTLTGHSINRDEKTDARARSVTATTATRAPVDRLEEMHRELEALVGGLRGIVSDESPAPAAPAEASSPPELAAEPLHAESARPEPIRDV